MNQPQHKFIMYMYQFYYFFVFDFNPTIDLARVICVQRMYNLMNYLII